MQGREEHAMGHDPGGTIQVRNKKRCVKAVAKIQTASLCSYTCYNYNEFCSTGAEGV